eukprot:4846978-Pleurochrysis_carterae.AAC.4
MICPQARWRSCRVATVSACRAIIDEVCGGLCSHPRPTHRGRARHVTCGLAGSIATIGSSRYMDRNSGP